LKKTLGLRLKGADETNQCKHPWF